MARLLLKEGVSLERVAIVGMRRLEKSCLAEKAELGRLPRGGAGYLTPDRKPQATRSAARTSSHRPAGRLQSAGPIRPFWASET